MAQLRRRLAEAEDAASSAQVVAAQIPDLERELAGTRTEAAELERQLEVMRADALSKSDQEQARTAELQAELSQRPGGDKRPARSDPRIGDRAGGAAPPEWGNDRRALSGEGSQRRSDSGARKRASESVDRCRGARESARECAPRGASRGQLLSHAALGARGFAGQAPAGERGAADTDRRAGDARTRTAPRFQRQDCRARGGHGRQGGADPKPGRPARAGAITRSRAAPEQRGSRRDPLDPPSRSSSPCPHGARKSRCLQPRPPEIP